MTEALYVIGIILFVIFVVRPLSKAAPPIPHPAGKSSRAITTHEISSIRAPEIPQFPAGTTHQIASETGTSTTYTVDLANVTCTCKDFAHSRAQRPRLHIPRLCKHLRQALLTSHRASLEDGIATMLEDEYIGGVEWVHVHSIEGDPVYFAGTTAGPWINVFARKRSRSKKQPPPKGPYQRYGYSRTEKRWAYGEGPQRATAIKEILSKMFS